MQDFGDSRAGWETYPTVHEMSKYTKIMTGGLGKPALWERNGDRQAGTVVDGAPCHGENTLSATHYAGNARFSDSPRPRPCRRGGLGRVRFDLSAASHGLSPQARGERA